MGDLDRALGAYERALIINSQSWPALTMAAHVCRLKEDYGRVSPVSNLLALSPPVPSPFSPTPPGHACVHISLYYFAKRAGPPPLLRSCLALEAGRRLVVNPLSMPVHITPVCVCVCVCICLPKISILFLTCGPLLVGSSPAPSPSRRRATSNERTSEQASGYTEFGTSLCAFWTAPSFQN